MKLPISVGEKFALVALDAATDILGPVDLGAGYLAAPRGAFELPGHWKEWLGSIKADAIERAGLLLLTKAHSNAPDVLDAENQFLSTRVGNLYWGLLASGRFWLEGAATQLTGTHLGERLDVRQVSSFDPVTQLRGLTTRRVGELDLLQAARLAGNLGDLFREPRLRRMRLAISTFMRAFSERYLAERIHQFVRVVDGLTRVAHGGRGEFARRCTTFVLPAQTETCWELYTIRSNAEHFQDPALKLPPLGRREDLERAFRRAHQAEELARYCVTRLVGRRDIWPLFEDDKLDAFWALPEADRAAAWGASLDLDLAVGSFNPLEVADE